MASSPQDAEQSSRLEAEHSAAFTLPDGRKLGYALYGSPTGRAVIGLHGLPGSRMEVAAWDDLGKKHNARMIGIDRPGYGWSTAQPDRTILDHAKDVERLAEHLDIKEYAVMGSSGGGPYALACAATIPAAKLKGVSVVVGMGPPDMSKHGMRLMHKIGYTFGYRLFPGLARWYFSRDSAAKLELSDEERLALIRQNFKPNNLHKRDAEWAKDTNRLDEMLRRVVRSTREAYAQGFEAVALDGKLISSDFGFRLEDIRKDLPIQLWYGKYDVWVPPIHGEQSAQRLGPKTRLHIEDETHMSMFPFHEERIFEELLACFSES